ncbi:ATP-binding protein [Paracoccus sp. TK19116]|uniref:ATP-binding protein n=2 Tax=Paracoccus albicereus TaxID=2922394 RepID=A0ABT1MUC9_9RHOB|nr:ATP-binding protein [Paracoccus albicereus]
MALHVLQGDPVLDVSVLATTTVEGADRVKVHGTRTAIIRAQAAVLGLPLVEIPLPDPCPNDIYQDRFAKAARSLADQGIRDWVFGDLFLADIRAFREAQIAALGLTAHFPLWGLDTTTLARRMIAEGIRARVVAMDATRMPETLAGALLDADFLDRLPEDVDPCGERGEFHTIVGDMPGFAAPLALTPVGTRREGDTILIDFALA